MQQLQQPQLFAVEQRLVIQQRFERLEVFLLPALLERQHKALLCAVGLAKRHQHPAARPDVRLHLLGHLIGKGNIKGIGGIFHHHSCDHAALSPFIRLFSP